MDRISPCTSLCVSCRGFSWLCDRTRLYAPICRLFCTGWEMERERLSAEATSEGPCREDAPVGRHSPGSSGTGPSARPRVAQGVLGADGRPGRLCRLTPVRGRCGSSFCRQGFLNTAFTIRQHPSAQHSSSKSFSPQAWDRIRIFLGHFFLIVCFHPHSPEVLTFLT